MLIVRHAKILLVSAVAFLGLLGVFNFLGWTQGYGMVELVVSMAEVPGGADFPWATDSPLIVSLGVLFIGLSKLVGGILCAAGAVQMWQARRAPSAHFQSAKSLALAGCGLQLFLFFFGFMYLANQLYMGWQTEMVAAASSAAFELGASVALIALFVAQPDTDVAQ